MMVSVVDALFLTTALAGLALCGLGVYTYRQYTELGVSAFVVFLGILGVGAILTSLFALFISDIVRGEGGPQLWVQTAIFVWGLSAVPWLVFTLQYSGRYTTIRRRTIGLLYSPFIAIGANFALGLFDIDGVLLIQSFIGTSVYLYSLALVLIGSAILLVTTYQYSHLSLTAGGLLAAGPLGLFFVINSLNFTTQYAVFGSALYTTGYVFATVVTALGVVQYESFEATPAVQTLGEREIVREIDDLVFVVDDCEHVIECNEAVTETLGRDRTAVLGESLPAIVGYGTDELRSRNTVTLDSADGRHRYDPQLSTITDQHDRDLGVLVSLHDVTDREMREQRLTVLNRVLRHNLRNKVEVVKGNAEVLDQERESDHLDTIVETAETIADLGDSARAIDRFVSASSGGTVVDIAETIEEELDRLDASEVTVALDTPPSPSVETNREALNGALDSALDNALAYANTTVEITVTEQKDGYEIAIADDGPGIPQSELDALDSGTETALQHGTGLGLWQLKWAVMTLGGDLEFDTRHGTTVTFTVPEQ
jgi:signal transduction histidine kinase